MNPASTCFPVSQHQEVLVHKLEHLHLLKPQYVECVHCVCAVCTAHTECGVLHKCVHVGGGCAVSCSAPSYPLEAAFLLNLEIGWWPANPRDPPVSAPHAPHQHDSYGHLWQFMWVLGIRTQVLVLCSKGSYPQRHLPSLLLFVHFYSFTFLELAFHVQTDPHLEM